MKPNRRLIASKAITFPSFLVTGTPVLAATVIALFSIDQSASAQTSWTGGAGQNWSSATWSSGVPTSGSAITLLPTAGATLTIPNGTAAVGASLDFSSTANNAGLTIADGGNLTLSGAITNTGNRSNSINISNTTLANAATVLTAFSITVSTGISLNAGGSAASHFSFGNNITTGVQLALGVSGNNGSNWTQTGGTTNVGGNTGYGLSIGQGATSAGQTGIATYNLNGGTLVGSRIGVLNGDGNSGGTTNRYAMNGVLNFNNGIIQNPGTGSLTVQNGIANSGSTANTAQFDTSKPLSVVLGGGTAREFQANTGNIIFSPSTVLSGTGNFTKTGTGSIVFTGGNSTNAALNTWSGNSTVTSGAIAVDYRQIAGEAATGGTDTLSGAYSAASRLVLNGGNFTMTGRGSASGTTATAGAIASNTQLTLPSTAGLVVGQSVSGTNVASGTYIRSISGSTIQLSHQTVGNAVINGNTLTFGAASFANTQTINDITLDATTSTVTVTPGAGTSTTQLDFGNVTGTGGLTKAGTGILKLTGALDYTGATAISAGTLDLAPTSGTSTLIGNVTGAGSLVKSGAGTTILATSTSGGSTLSGSLSVTGGTLQIGNTTTSNVSAQRLTSVSSVNVGTGAVLVLKNSSALPSGAPITLSGTLNTDASNVVGGGFFSALGPITFNGGTLTTSQGANASNFQSYALNGTIMVTGSSASSITSTGLSTSGNGIHLAHNTAGVSRIFDVADVTGDANADLTISARLLNSSNNAGATGITKTGSGTLSLTGVNSCTGSTTVSDGTLSVGDGTANSALADGSEVIIEASAVLNLNFLAANSDTVDKLTIGGIQKASGTWGASGSGATNIDNVHFSGPGTLNVTTGPAAGYTSWASTNGVPGQAANLDHDNDGVSNGVEHFIGGPTGITTGFTPLPGVITVGSSRSVTWVKAASYTGTYGTHFIVETSTTLAGGSWTTETLGGNVTISGNNVTYTFPAAGPVKNFARLNVTGP